MRDASAGADGAGCRPPAAPVGRLEPLTAERAVDALALADLAWSGDGRRLALTVTEPPGPSGQHKHVWVYTPEGDRLRPFTSSPKSESRPRWAPDGSSLAFLSDREGEGRQLYVMPTTGGEARRLTGVERPVAAFEWSPDGKTIAFVGPRPKTEADERRAKDHDDARVVDDDDTAARVWRLDVASGRVVPLLGAPWRVSELAWSPGGDQLFVVATEGPEAVLLGHQLLAVNPADGSVATLASVRGAVTSLRVGPGGRWLAFLGCRDGGPSVHDLFVVPAGGGTPRNVSARSLDRAVEAYAWRGDGRLLAAVEYGFRTRLVSLTVSGEAAPAFAPALDVSALDVAPGGKVAFVGESATRPQELWVAGPGGAPRAVSKLHAAFGAVALATPRFVTYKSFDGREIEAMLLEPTRQLPRRRSPTVVLVHGGPAWRFADQFHPLGQVLAAAGYLVFMPNVRGSTGYGYEFMTLARGDWGFGDYKDLMAGVDHLVESGLADGDRLAIAGWSYGGYMAEWAVSQSGRFKAAVAGAGLSNLISEFGTEEHPSYDEWYFGLPWEHPERFLRSSPITHVAKVRTPTLLVHGADDRIDPLGQSEEFYRALRHYGVRTELVVYPREGHELKERAHRLDWLNRTVSWVRAHVGAE